MPQDDFVSKALASAKGALKTAEKKFPTPIPAAAKPEPVKPVPKPLTEREQQTESLKYKAEQVKGIREQTGPGSFKKGGKVAETGIYKLEKGEEVIPAKKIKNPSLYRALRHLNKGGLHRALGIEEGKPIPEDRLEAATHSTNSHIMHMALMAKNMDSWKK